MEMNTLAKIAEVCAYVGIVSLLILFGAIVVGSFCVLLQHICGGINNMNNEKKSGGVGFLPLLCLAFIVLKLCHIISWSWWWVLSPIWIDAILITVIIVLTFIKRK